MGVQDAVADGGGGGEGGGAGCSCRLPINTEALCI